MNSGYKNIAVVTHGGVIRSMIAHFLGIDLARWRTMAVSLENCSISELDYHEDTGRFYLERLNDCLLYTSFLEKDPETAKAFLRAVSRGYEYAIENPEKAAEILCAAAPELDPQLVIASQKYLADQYQADAERWGYIDPARWNAFYGWLNDHGLSEAPIPENAGFSNDYLPQ